MLIEFEYLKFKNILSYGNTLTSINFTSGINLLLGINGSGKSSIGSDILCYALFGVPYRKVKIDELINRTNKTKLFTEIKFKINNDSYIIQRGIKPSLFSITKNDIELDLLSSKKLNQQEINKIIGIDEKIFRNIISLAVNYNQPFLSLSIPEKRDIIENLFDIKVFSEMLKISKKKLTEFKTISETDAKILYTEENNIKLIRKQINDIKIAEKKFIDDKAKEIADVDNRINKLQQEKNELSIDVQIKELDDSKNNIKQQKEESIILLQNDKGEKFDNNILNLQNEKMDSSEIEKLNNDLDTFKIIVKDMNNPDQPIKLIDITDTQKKIDDIKKRININVYDEDKIVKDLKLIDNKTCPILKITCDTILSKSEEYNIKICSIRKNIEELRSELKIKENEKIIIESDNEQYKDIQKILNEIKIVEDKITYINKSNDNKCELINKQIEEINKQKKNYLENIDKQIQTIRQNIIDALNAVDKEIVLLKNNYIETLKKIDEQIEYLKNNKVITENKKFNLDVIETEKELDIKAEKYKELYSKHTVDINNIKKYEIINKILDDDGIKTYFCRKYIPLLNTKTKEYLNMFNLPVRITFDETMEEKIYSMDSRGNQVNYFSFSEGEKKRIDMSLLLSFISLSKQIANWNCNLLFVDELLDGALDNDGLDNLMIGIKKIYNENKNCIYIITHRNDLKESSYFNNVIEVKKNNNFSELKI